MTAPMPTGFQEKCREGGAFYCECVTSASIPRATAQKLLLPLTYFYYFVKHSELAFDEIETEELNSQEYLTLANNAKIAFEEKDRIDDFVRRIFHMLYGHQAQKAFHIAWKVADDHLEKQMSSF